MVKALPYGTRTQGTNKVSDITNLIFIGKASWLRRAFDAAGWIASDELNAASTFQPSDTFGQSEITQAPMSKLLLDEQKPLFTLSKTTNTFSSRHHIRVLARARKGRETVLTASSTQDIGIAFSAKQKTFIHMIDQYLDNERSKVSNALLHRCVDGSILFPPLGPSGCVQLDRRPFADGWAGGGSGDQ